MLTEPDIAINEREKDGEGAVACRLRIPEDVSRGEQIMLPGDARIFLLALRVGLFSLRYGMSQPAGYANGSNPFGCTTPLRVV